MTRPLWRLDPILIIAIVAQSIFGAAFIASTRFDAHGQTYFTLFDDAMVSMTYARNLAAGDGLVWNAGGPAVEGYTNFIWTLWMTALHLVGAPESTISLFVMVSGLLILVANLVVLWKLAVIVSTSVTTARLTVLVASLCYPLIFWTLRGMEVGLMALVVNLAVLQALRGPAPGQRPVAFLVSLLLLPLIRPDGIVPAAIIAAFATLIWIRAGQNRAALAIIATPFVILLAHTGFRLWLYGDALPNTYYLKVAGISLIDRLSRGVATLWETTQTNLWLTFALGFLIRFDERVRLIAAVVATQVCYSVWVGGDAWEQSHYANRYLAVVLPLAVLLAARGVERLLAAPRSLPRAVVVGVIGQVLLVSAVSEGVVTASFSPVTWSDAMTLAGVILKGAIAVWFLVAASMVAMNRPVAPRSPTIGVLVPVACALLMTLSGPFVGEWLDGDALHVKDDARAARLGLALRAHTSPEATIGVTWAGAIPYFARRTAIDFLGKSDRHIAHLPPRPPFVPGHNKWDYAYSIGEQKPDVIAQTWNATPADIRLFSSFGYEPVGRDAFVRTGTSAVDLKAVAEAFADFDRSASRTARPQR